MVVKIPYAGGQVPTQTVAPACTNALAMANPKPPSSATPATSARLPVRSIASMRGILRRRCRGSQATLTDGAFPATFSDETRRKERGMRLLWLSLLVAGCSAIPPNPVEETAYAADTLGSCMTAEECAPDEYCEHGDACGAPGSCRNRPLECAEIYRPVCGCDGRTWSN